MAVSGTFRQFVQEQLERVLPVRTRSMFGGVGIYSGDLFFALIDDDVLYFKADEENRPDFEAAGMEPFRPMEDERPMQYYALPGGILEDVELLESWVKKAVAAAARKKRRGS